METNTKDSPQSNPPTETQEAKPGWLASVPKPVIDYGWALLKALAYIIAIAIAVRFGGVSTSVIPVPTAMVSEERDYEPPAETLFHCGRMETLADTMGVTTKPWPNREITWNVDTSGYKGSLTADQVREAFDVAWKAWAKWIDITPRYIEDHDAALVQCHFDDIDGTSKVLAWSELADGKNTPKTQRYDRAERWTIATNPTQATIDIVRVACHEIGHVLGLLHDDVDTDALMRPTYSLQTRFPTARDAQRLYALGYKKRPNSSPAPPVTISVSIDPERLAEALRSQGYEVKLLGR